MPEPIQTFDNHVRYHPSFHYFMFPVFTINFGWAIAQLVRHPEWDSVIQLLTAMALIVLMLTTRVYSLRVQDRVIRLEERLRYQRVLSPDLAAKASEMPVRFIVALRFAPDAELAGLVQRALAGEFVKGNDAKKAIKNWRADHLRV